ncbi:MAG: alpha/beta fold hydrolase [Verrucomicrobiota bacterium]
MPPMIFLAQMGGWGWVLLLPAIPLVWVVGDYAYSCMVGWNLRRWERAVQRDADGVRAGCREFTRGDGPTALLMIHGFADAPPLFQNFADALASRGFTCRVMRLPDSSVPIADAARVRHVDWLRAVAAELKALRASHPRVWIVAHSLGCTLSIEHLLEHPGDIDGLVLIAPLIEVSRRRSPVFPARTWFLIAHRLLHFTQVAEILFPIDGYTKEARAHRLRDRFISRTIYAEMFDAIAKVVGTAGRITKPLLMVLSPRDRVIDSRTAARFFEVCAASPKKLIYADRSGHVIPIDADWREVADAIVQFIQSAGSNVPPGSR